MNKRNIFLVITIIFLLFISGCKKNNNPPIEDDGYCTVIFNSNGGTNIDSQKVERNSKIQTPSEPTRDGYTFDGWYYGNEKWSFIGYIATENMTLSAKWIANNYAINLDVNGGTALEDSSIEVQYDSKFDLPIPQRPGYSFEGWYYGEDKVSEGKYSYPQDVTLVAKWQIRQYTLKIKYNDGVTSDLIITQDYNTDIQEIANPERLGYTFSGWDKEIPTKMPATYTVINAEWICDVEYMIEDISYITITGPVKKKGEIVILDEYEGLPTRKIGAEAFSKCTNITNFVIPNSVVSIGYKSFERCSSLTRIIFPNSLTEIGACAFMNCTKITRIAIPENVTYIGDLAFDGCGITSIVVDENNKVYDSRENCNAIINTKSNKLILGCSNTIIPYGVVAIENSAFRGCKSLRGINIPNSVKSIESYAFSGCSSLTSIIIPISVEYVGEYAFGEYGYITIYCEAKSQPEEWSDMWMPKHATVVWDYKAN